MSGYSGNLARLDAAIDSATERGESPWWIIGVLMSGLSACPDDRVESVLATLERS